MKKAFLLLAVAVLTIGLAGCGDGDGRSVFVTDILSDATVDGFIAEDLSTGILSPPVIADTPGIGFVRVGIDPALGLSGVEYRGFLHFPLGGAAGVPINASIVTATLEIFINRVPFGAPVPVRMDLIDFPPPLISDDYDTVIQPSLLTRSNFDILPGDAPRLRAVRIDVTSLMQEAQRRGLPAFQVRLLLPFTPPGASGLFEIDDAPAATAPLLTVEYTLP